VLAAARTAPGWEQVDLGPLDLETSLRLLTGLEDHARERVAREAHGNPLFLRELERTGGVDLPATVLGAVERELAELAPGARLLLKGAAVAGDPFDPELAAAAAARPADAAALDALVAADLVRATGRGRGFAFRHPLVRRAVYDVAPPCWRLQAHERVAAALERRGAAPAVRAYHVARFARPGEEAAVDLLSAAAAAATPAGAARWYGKALALVPETDTARRAQLLGPLAFALCDAGRLEEGRAATLEALALTPGHVPLVVAAEARERVAELVADQRVVALSADHVLDVDDDVALDDVPARVRLTLRGSGLRQVDPHRLAAVEVQDAVVALADVDARIAAVDPVRVGSAVQLILASAAVEAVLAGPAAERVVRDTPRRRSLSGPPSRTLSTPPESLMWSLPPPPSSTSRTFGSPDS
jgi:hypothetical protein